jgi:hypothetical protein
MGKNRPPQQGGIPSGQRNWPRWKVLVLNAIGKVHFLPLRLAKLFVLLQTKRKYGFIRKFTTHGIV